MAVTGFVFALIPVTAVIGVALCHGALYSVDKTGRRGGELAVAGMVIGYLSVILGVLLWIALIIGGSLVGGLIADIPGISGLIAPTAPAIDPGSLIPEIPGIVM